MLGRRRRERESRMEGVDVTESEFRLSDIAETREHLFEDSYELERELSADLDAYFRTTDETDIDRVQPRYIGGGKDGPAEEEKPTEATGLTD